MPLIYGYKLWEKFSWPLMLEFSYSFLKVFIFTFNFWDIKSSELTLLSAMINVFWKLRKSSCVTPSALSLSFLRQNLPFN